MLTVKQTSKILNVNESRVRQFIYGGRLQSQKCICGQGLLIKKSEVERFAAIERRTGKPRKEKGT